MCLNYDTKSLYNTGEIHKERQRLGARGNDQWEVLDLSLSA